MHIYKIAAVALALCLPCAGHAAPNILLIIADDMGLDTSRCYAVGDQQANMPILEQLCAEGLVFDQAYSAPVCSPTRATIMTGKYGFRTGVGGAIPPRGGSGLSPDEFSLFDALNETEYASAVVGKWHLASSPDDLDHPAEMGVTDYFGMISGGVRSYYNWQGVENGTRNDVDGYTTTVLTDRAINWIGERQTPWFLWLAYNAPHTPFHVPPRTLYTGENLKDDETAIRENPLPYYNAMLEALDTEVGRLFDSMSDETRENTIVIFIGDNGTPGQVSRQLYGARRSKGSIYQGGTAVPMIVSGPGVEGGRTEALVNTTDLNATILALAGADPDGAVSDGIDLNTILKGETGSREFAYVEHFGDGGMPVDVMGWAIRDAQYMLVAPDGDAEQMFDIANDPLSQFDLLSATLTPELNQRVLALRAAYQDLRGD
ncbi:Arylsulfatase precursor [Thalassovita gelatinovora]|uniref:Arylsulfatase n=1 Tax=Thalassovita gelatinovora TaxID=53501 RepID=A0A0P1G3F3_THAGE|nr:sulfatase-like hydrolase/transferase [Thalassovita gelatinovora]QIZ81987.1 sulfatase-like hydrolase/transferase [Thalassovita gelatinovora]CUH67428.1 Arylsulfatase precursor [Thalassovita gelatinovora]SEP74213.1 Arylsulfatase A [Thalassovita gelatinovora]